jgi:membrane protein YdbS with pleckstrin-like domain
MTATRPVWSGTSEAVHLLFAVMSKTILRRVLTLVDPANPPSRRAPLVWAIAAAIPWALLAVAQVVWFVVDRPPPGRHDLGWLHALAAAATLLGIVTFVVVAPLWRYRVHRWEIGPQAVCTRSGWLVQERRIAPISRVQTVDTHRGPIDRLFGLADVTVTTASSAGAVRIVALDSDVADRIAAQLTDIAAIGDRDAT